MVLNSALARSFLYLVSVHGARLIMMNRMSLFSLSTLTALALTALPACSSSTGSTGGGGATSTTSTTSITSTDSSSSTGGGGGSGGEASTTSSTTATATSSVASTSTGAAPVCGDGNVDPGEACDDANATDGDGCSKACVKECSSLHFVANGIATAADPSTLSVTSVTLAVWYNAVAGAPFAGLVAKRGNTPGGHFTYQLTAGPGGLGARLQTNVNLEFLDLVYPAAVPDGTWHHAAITYDAATGNGNLFFDGKPVATGTKGTGLVAADPTQPFTVGGTSLDGVPNNLAKADISDIAVYGMALSAGEVQSLHQGKYPVAPPLALFFTPEGMGVTSADASGKGHTLKVPTNGWAATGPFCTP